MRNSSRHPDVRSDPEPDDLPTERLLLRLWHPDDAQAISAGHRRPHWADDFPAEGDVVIAGVVATVLAEAAAGSAEVLSHRLIVERAGGLVVGSTSLLWPPADGAVEFGYGVVASRRGLGYATEAAHAMLRFGLGLPGVHSVRADVERENIASVRVLEKCGLHVLAGDGATARYSTAPATQP